MKKRFSAALGGLALAVLAVGRSTAEEGRWEFALAPGYAVPIGAAAQYSKSSPNLRANLDYRANDWVSVGLEGGYSFAHRLRGHSAAEVTTLDETQVNVQLPFDSDIDARTIQVSPVVKIGKSIRDGGTGWASHLSLGAGVYLDSYKAGTINFFTAGQRVPIPAQKLKGYFGFNVGLGVEFILEESFKLGIDAKVHDYLDRNDKPTIFLTPAVRLAFLF